MATLKGREYSVFQLDQRQENDAQHWLLYVLGFISAAIVNGGEVAWLTVSVIVKLVDSKLRTKV